MFGGSSHAALSPKEEIQFLKDKLSMLTDRLIRLEENQKQQEHKKVVYTPPKDYVLAPPAELTEAQKKSARKTILGEPLIVQSGSKKTSLEVSGHISRTVVYADDGHRGRLFHADNGNSKSRVRFVANGELTEDVTAGAKLEVEIPTHDTLNFDIDTKADNRVPFRARVADVWMDSKRFGRLTLGHGPTASDGTSEVDLSGTKILALGGSAEFMVGGLRYREKEKLLGILSQGPRIRESYSGKDGLARRNRARYDSPKFMGFQLSASHADRQGSDEHANDVALRFAHELSSGAKFQSAIAYANITNDSDQINGSASMLFSNGISLTGAGGYCFNAVMGRKKSYSVLGKLGYQFKLLPYGLTALAADYGFAKSIHMNDDRSHVYGFFLVQNFDSIATEFYTGIRIHRLIRSGSRFRRILAVMTGFKTKF